MFQVLHSLFRLYDLKIEYEHLALTQIDQAIAILIDNENHLIQRTVKCLLQKWRVIRSSGEAEYLKDMAEDEKSVIVTTCAIARLWK